MTNQVSVVPDISQLAGGLGRYQIMLVIMVIFRSFPSSWTLSGLEFIAGDVQHYCAPPANFNESLDFWRNSGIPKDSTGLLNKCERYGVDPDGLINHEIIEQCDKWIFNQTQSSAVVDFELVCDRKWFKSSVQSVVFASQIAGALIMGKVSDTFGRKRTYISSVIIFILFGASASLANSVMIFNVLRFLMCFGIAGINTTVSTFYTEVAQPKYRSLLQIGLSLGFQIPLIMFPALAGFLDNWRYVQLCMALSALTLVPFFFSITESPRWLLTKGRTSAAKKSLQWILKFNKIQADLDVSLPLIEEKLKEKPQKESFSDVWSYPHLRLSILGLFFAWFFTQFCFFSTIYLSSKIPGDKSLNFALSACGGLVGGICAVLILRFGRRSSSLRIVLGLASILNLIEAFLPSSPTWPHLLISVATRFLLVITVGVTWTFTLEVLPTTVRNFAFSCCFCFGRIAGILAPFVRDLIEINTSLPHAIISAFAFLCLIALIPVPETAGIPLPDNIQQSDELARTASILKRAPKELKTMFEDDTKA